MATSTEPPACRSHSANGLRFVLACLREFADLLDVYQLYTRHGRFPPPSIRLRFKTLESALPARLAQYIHYLAWHPRQPGFVPVTNLTRKGCCRQCGIAAHPEWVDEIARGGVIYICAACGGIFVPPLPLPSDHSGREA